ncbi:hypothetical protein MUO79_01460 [Candidatus Bathyarchaeota archaeon]|nr:hypothetical protein [Candidatus Bathyarchaeota archaeon]
MSVYVTIDAFEAAFIILISVIVSGIGTLLVLRLYLKKYAPYVRMARQFASQMGMKSQVVQHDTRMKVMQKEAKAKVAKAAIESLPMGGILGKIIDKAGISPEEIFALLQDQDFIKGIKVLMDTFSGVVGKITGKDKTEDQTQQFDQTQFGQ